MPTFPSFDLSSLDLSKLDWSKFDWSKFDWSKFDLSKVDWSKLGLPTFEPSSVDLPQIDFDRLLGLARDTAYVGVGLTVLAVQRAQEARRDATNAVKAVERRVRDLIPA